MVATVENFRIERIARAKFKWTLHPVDAFTDRSGISLYRRTSPVEERFGAIRIRTDRGIGRRQRGGGGKLDGVQLVFRELFYPGQLAAEL